MKRLAVAMLVACAVLATAGPASAIKQFIVFFNGTNPEELDPDQWRIGPEGDAVINEAANAFKGYPRPNLGIALVAGDQHVGTLEMSVERSRKRAEAVKESLVKYGVPDDAIVIHACGFRRFLIETPHGTKEPQNRFVALDLTTLGENSTDACK